MAQHSIYPERESKSLELKSLVPKFEALIKTCIAFANGAGGQIVIGVEDQTRYIIGITEQDRNRIYDDFPNSLYDAVKPTIPVQIYERNTNAHTVLIIEVPYCEKKPYCLQRDGLPKGVYVRVGTSTRRVNPEHYEELLREGTRKNFDEMIIDAPALILSKELLHNYFDGSVGTRRLLAEKIVTQNNIANTMAQPTVAGVLAFCETPENYIPEALIICTQFGNKKTRDIIQTQEITGPIAQQAHIAFRLVSHWLERDLVLQGTQLKGKLPIPAEALREAIINALIHRKYSIAGAIKIALYDDRLEVFSPGCFPGLVDINHLGDGTTYLRNPTLARIARKLRLVEKLGSGIRLIFDSCRKAGIKQPEYVEDGDFVKIIFYFAPVKKITDTDFSAILKLSKIKPELSISDIMGLLNISRNTVTRKLNQFIAEGRLQRFGRGPAVRYRVVEK